MISKSKYLSGHQCHKKLYLEKNRPDLKPPVDDALQAIFNQGHRVGLYAQQVYPKGKDATPQNRNAFNWSIQQTKKWILAGEKVIYEATFASMGGFAMLDILLQEENGDIHAIEVKSSTSVKDYHLIDASLQYFVMAKSGFAPKRFSIMHIDNSYTKNGELNVSGLFKLEDITEKVLQLQSEVPKRLGAMQEMLAQNEEPYIDIGPHCNNPFDCDFRHYCWRHVPKDSVFDLPRAASKAWQFYREGRIKISDLETEELTPTQIPHYREITENTGAFDRVSIRNWLKQIEYPICFLDFETIQCGIPIYDNSRPYQQIPVQYSIHWIEKEDAPIEHFEYLADFTTDPRIQQAQSLSEKLEKAGNIMAFNMSFEKKCIESIAALNQDLSQTLTASYPKFVDLIEPFRKGWAYFLGMKGRNSIKRIYGSMFPDSSLNYQGLKVADGGTASTVLKSLAESEFKGSITEMETIRGDLLEYCKLDTMAMVKIWEYLGKRVTP